jgi:hypothetical protein
MSTQFDTQNTHSDDTYAYGQPAADHPGGHPLGLGQEAAAGTSAG